MLYLSCSFCGYNNAVKTETFLFCEKCGKKLQNNFRDWHKLHPDKTFDQYSKTHCISEFDLENRSVAKEKNNTPKIVAIVFASIFALLIIIGVTGYFITKHFLDNNLTTQTNKSILNTKWERKLIGTSALSIKLPFDVDIQEINLSEEVKNSIDVMESFSHISDNGFKVITVYSTYKSGLIANLDAAVNGAVNEVKNLQGITDFKWNRTDTLIGNKTGAIILIQYKLVMYNIHLKTLIVCNNNKLWQVITQYSSDDISGKEASEKILSSTEIK